MIWSMAKVKQPSYWRGYGEPRTLARDISEHPRRQFAGFGKPDSVIDASPQRNPWT